MHFEGPVGRGGLRTDELVGGTSREASEGGEGGGGALPVGGGCLCGVSVHYSISYTAPIPSPVPSSIAATPAVGLLQISREPGDSQKSEGPGGSLREGYRDLVRGHRSGRNSLVCDV